MQLSGKVPVFQGKLKVSVVVWLECINRLENKTTAQILFVLWNTNYSGTKMVWSIKYNISLLLLLFAEDLSCSTSAMPVKVRILSS